MFSLCPPGDHTLFYLTVSQVTVLMESGGGYCILRKLTLVLSNN